MASRLLLALALFASLALRRGAADDAKAGEDPVHINKCCWKGERWDLAKVQCRPSPWSKQDSTLSEKLVPPMDAEAVNWLPAFLRSRTVIARYDGEIVGNEFAIITANDDIVKEFLLLNTSAGIFVGGKYFPSPLDERSFYKQMFCIDRTWDENVPHVLISGVGTRYINKCCPYGERLRGDAHRCEVLPSGARADWRPASPFANMSGVRDFPVESLFPWNVAVRSNETNDFHWRLTAPLGYTGFNAWVRGTSRRNGRILEGVAWNYCFDAVGEGDYAPRVLLAAVAEAIKCCRRNHRLSKDGQNCEPFTPDEIVELKKRGLALQPEETEDQLDEVLGRLGEEKIESSPWIPPALNASLNATDGLVSVAYSTRTDLKLMTVLDADEKDSWRLEFPSDDLPKLWLTPPAREGTTVRQLAESYCFDAQATTRGVRRALVVHAPCKVSGVVCLHKCCPVGQLLNAAGRCRERPPPGQPGLTPRDWDPMVSLVKEHLPANITALAEFSFEDACLGSAFVLHNPTPKDAAQHLQEPSEEIRFMQLYHCADLLLADKEGEEPREAFAYCVSPPVAPVYVGVRPLQVLAALLLVVGLVATLGDEDTRRSVHGCALASHAACLLASNTLQVLWFITYDKGVSCDYLAYAVYFFLVAAGVWLNVVSVNMAWGFRQPLGARAITQRGGRKMWRSFALWSAYGWGLPAVLTAFSVCMHINAQLVTLNNYTAPSFFETRTCLGEDSLTPSGKALENWGAVFYYYIPMTLLVVANAACLVLTTSTIMAMKKETAVLKKMGNNTGAANRGLQNARMYVKLLLSAGITEIGLEMVAWAARRRNWSPNFLAHNLAVAQQMIYIFNIVATFVDVARALAVLWLSAGRCRWRCWPWPWPGVWWRSATRRVALTVGALRARRRRQRSQAKAQAQAQTQGQVAGVSSDGASADTTNTTTTEASVGTSTTGC